MSEYPPHRLPHRKYGNLVVTGLEEFLQCASPTGVIISACLVGGTNCKAGRVTGTVTAPIKCYPFLAYGRPSVELIPVTTCIFSVLSHPAMGHATNYGVATQAICRKNWGKLDIFHLVPLLDYAWEAHYLLL